MKIIGPRLAAYIRECELNNHNGELRSEVESMKTDQAKRDLEMKAKGITDAILWLDACWADNLGDSVICVDDLVDYARTLRNQAGAL